MANIVGGGNDDPLWESVRFIYSLRANYHDTGPNSLADATPNGGGYIATFFTGLFAGGGGYFGAGTDDNRLSLPQYSVPNEGAGDWTLDLWVFGGFSRLSSIYSGIFNCSSGEAQPTQLAVQSHGDGDVLSVQMNADDTTFFQDDGTTLITDNTPHHMAVCRNGNTVYCYLDGLLEISFDVTGKSFNFSNNNHANNIVECLSDGLATLPLATGAIGYVRWTSAARYDGTTFTPALPYDGTDAVVDETLKLRAWGFELDGHKFYVLRCGQQGTSVYDIATEQWSEFVTVGYTTWNAEHGIDWNGYAVAADQSAATVWKVDPATSKDMTTLDITRIVTGGYPARGRDVIPCNAVRLTASVGAPSAAAPTVSLRWSDDNGQSWSTPRSVTLVTADYDQEVAWRALGVMRAPGRVFEITDVGGLIRIDGADIEDGSSG